MQEKKKGFRVKIEDISKIFEQIRHPNSYLEAYQLSEPYQFGKTALSPPLKEIRLLAHSSGKDITLEAYIDIDSYFADKDTSSHYYPVRLPLEKLDKKFYISSARKTAVHIYPHHDSEEPIFVIVKKHFQITISAGKSDEESAPAIPIVSEQDLLEKLEFLAKIIEITVRGIYEDYAKLNLKFPAPDVIFYIRGPIVGKEADGGEPQINILKPGEELKTAIHKINPEDIEETLDDVQGVEEAKEEVVEVIDILKNPEKYEKMGAKIPKGVLLTGPPGTGKTMLAKATAKAAGVPFFSVSGSEFVEIFVGRGAGRVRKLFEEARKNIPCIIFIDELDALGRQRSGGAGGSSEYDHALSQLLVELDGFGKNKGIVVMAATNAPELLDPGVTRPGRLDRQITLDLPDADGREAILKVHSKNKPLAKDVDFKKIALSTPNFSGADLALIINEAALLSIRNGKNELSMEYIRKARDRVHMGAERKTRIIYKEKLEIAYHEIGHALVRTLLYPNANPVEIATIKPRGNYLGIVMSLSQGDSRSQYKNRLEAQLAVSLAGRVAEELILGKDNYSTGASADMRNSTNLARRMVTEWGMGKKTGLASLGRSLAWKFLGGVSQGAETCSEKTSRMIDDEIRRMLKRAYKKAKKILKKHIKELHHLAQMLVKKETLGGEELRRYLKRPLPDDFK